MAVSVAPVTQEQVQSFQEKGFTQSDDVLTPEELSDFRGALAEATGQAELDYFYREGGEYTQHVNLWASHAGVRRHVFNPKLAEIARTLSQSERVRLWHDQLIVKMPGNDPSRWHQDLPLWPMIDAGPLTCWIALVDVTVEMGCMSFLPGSHRWGRLAAGTLPGDLLASLEGVRLLVPEDRRENLQPVTIELKAGSCTFHDSLALHFAGPNQTDKPRQGFIINYMPNDVRFSGKSHVTTDPLDLAVGQPIAGELFPILASKEQSEVAQA
jgi:ectoine hydroxylase-related dioxygenase (phytanoyl-CoA dioxygenase family)